MNKKCLGEKIKIVRKAKKLTQAQLAELSGTNEKHISKIETGVYFPTFSTLAKILKALDLNIDNLSLTKNSTTKNTYYYKIMDEVSNIQDEQILKMIYNILQEIRIVFTQNKL